MPVGTLTTHINAATAATASSLATASYNPVASSGSLFLALVLNRRGATTNTPTGSGNGHTWVQIGSSVEVNDGTVWMRATWFRAMGTGGSPMTSGGFTADFASQSQQRIVIHVYELAGAKTGGSEGSAAIRQSKTNTASGAGSLTITLDNSLLTGSAIFSGLTSLIADGTDISAEAGYTEIGEQSNAIAQSHSHVMWRSTDTDSSPTHTAASGTAIWAGVAFEVLPEPLVFSQTGSGGISFGGSATVLFSPAPIMIVTPMRKLPCDIVKVTDSGRSALKIPHICRYGPMEWPVFVGVNTLNVDCKYSADPGASSRPQLIVLANPAVGLHSDKVSTANAGANVWDTIPAISFEACAEGVVLFYFNHRNATAYSFFGRITAGVGL